MDKVWLVLSDCVCMGDDPNSFEDADGVILGCKKTREAAEKAILEKRAAYKKRCTGTSFDEWGNKHHVYLRVYENGQEMAVLTWRIFGIDVEE